MSIISRLFRAGPRTPANPAAPGGLRIYAVGDVHGRFDLLTELSDKIRADLADNPPAASIEIYIGDYVDRGPDARSVIEWLRSDTAACDERICLKGNHEDIFLQFIADPGMAEYWRDLGGFETLYSYGVQPPVARTGEAMLASHEQLMQVLPAEDVKFLQSLPLYASFGDYLFVHAGLRPGLRLEKQVEEDLIWIREPFLTSGHDFGQIVVHGHTPGDAPDIRGNRINIDTGAFLTGCLTCLVLERTGRRFIQSGAKAVDS
jgi:serine/threonine protein phosphatase 1